MDNSRRALRSSATVSYACVRACACVCVRACVRACLFVMRRASALRSPSAAGSGSLPPASTPEHDA